MKGNDEQNRMVSTFGQGSLFMTAWRAAVEVRWPLGLFRLVAAVGLIGLAMPPAWAQAPVACYTYRIKAAFPHDARAFTQGLVYHGGYLYESTGLKASSSIRKVALETGKVLQIRHLAPKYFGEGLTILDRRMYQLTWTSRTGLIYDVSSFEPLGTFSYPTEGWGLTHDGRRLIMSDGSAFLYFLDPGTLKTIRRIEVRDPDGPIGKLNELEYVGGEIYANIWGADTIVRIAPDTGQVVGWIDLSGLLSGKISDRPVDVLNGIAYDTENKRLFVTGKWWPWVFEIELVPTRQW
jgi:glutaminyl-peptide cyclotransferase